MNDVIEKIIMERPVEMGKILDDLDLLMRVSICKKTVAQYASAMKNGSIFPPVELMDVDGELYLTNGFHRLHARRSNGETSLLARVCTGSYEDAQDAAAASGDSHKCLPRSNSDKSKVVNMLIRMERHMDDSDRAIAKMAGVEHHLVARERKKLKSSGGALPHLKEPSRDSKPKKRKGIDGKHYPAKGKKKAKKQAPQTSSLSPTPTAVDTPSISTKYTPEQIGWPDPAIADLPDPDHPGYTHAQWFIFQHGHVHLMPVAEQTLAKRQIALREFSSAVRKLGEAAKEFTKAPCFTPEEYFRVAATMENGARLWVGKLTQHMDSLLSALQLLEPFKEQVRPLPVTETPPEEIPILTEIPTKVA